MRAVKLTVQIGNDRVLNLQLPADVPSGMAEVIVLYEETSVSSKPYSLEEFTQHPPEVDIPRRGERD